MHPKRDLYLGDLRLEAPQHAIPLTVALADGTPVPDALLFAFYGSWDELRKQRSIDSTQIVTGRGAVLQRTGADGTCDLRVRRGGPWCIWVRRVTGTMHTSALRAPDLEIEADGEPVVLTLDTGMLRIALHDADGNPTAGAPWELTGWLPHKQAGAERAWRRLEGHKVLDVYTDAEADVHFVPTWENQEGLAPRPEVTLLGPPGMAWIGKVATRGGQRGRARFETPETPSAEPEVLRMQRVPLGAIRFVPQVEGEPVNAFFQYQWLLGNGRSLPSGVFQGTHELKNLSAGEYRFIFLNSDHVILKRRLTVRVADGERKTVKLPVLPGGQIDLRVGAPGSKIAEHTPVVLKIAPEQGKPITRRIRLYHDPDGGVFAWIGGLKRKTVSSQRFPPGRTRIWLEKEGFTCEPVEAEVRVERVTRFDLVLLPK